jgi:hypothetical protein
LQWCQNCTDWKLGVEPSVVVGPAPNSAVAPDEIIDNDDDDDDDSDDDDNYHDDDGTSTVYETGVRKAFHFGAKISF